MKYEKEFRKAMLETIGETDKEFDNSNYTEWLESKTSKLVEALKQCSLFLSKGSPQRKLAEQALKEFKGGEK